jgi:hypothetical protein
MWALIDIIPPRVPARRQAPEMSSRNMIPRAFARAKNAKKRGVQKRAQNFPQTSRSQLVELSGQKRARFKALEAASEG